MDAARQRRRQRGFLGILGGLLVCSLVSADSAVPVNPRTLALVGGRLLTQTDAGAVTGTILIRDGTILAAGPTVTVPADAERIDVTGFTLTPGLIDARSTLGLTPDATRESASDGGLDVLDGVDPHEEDWKEVIRQGVTAVYVQPSANGILGGRGAVLRVGPAESVEQLVLKASAGAQAALGTVTPAQPAAAAPAFGGRRGGITPPVQEPAQPAATATGSGNSLLRYNQYEQLRRALEAAKQSDDGPGRAARAGIQAAEKKGAAAKAAPAGRARREGTQEFLRKVLHGEIPLRIEAHREDDIRNALRLADEFKLRLVLEGVSNPRTAIESIVSRRLPLVLGPVVELETPPAYRKDRPADWLNALVASDTRWALGTFSSQPRGSRLLRVHAAAAVAQGIDPERVLRALTRDAAEILGVGDRLGTIAAGKRADLVVFAGDPLDPSVPVRLVVSGGRVVYQADVRAVPAAVRLTSRPELPARLPKKYALKTRHLLMEDGNFQAGTVLVDNGKVVGLGPALTVSADVPTYDLGAAVLTPGLVAGPYHLGLAGAIDDPAEADAGQVRAADAYDPQHRPARRMLEGGFTCAVVTPGSANVIAGTSIGVRLGAAEPFLGDVGVKFVLTGSSRGGGRLVPESADELPIARGRGGAGRGPDRYPGSLAGQVELIEQALSGRAPRTELYLPQRVREQIQAERRQRMSALLERKQVAFFEAHTRAEIDAALQLIARFNLRGVLVGPEEIKPFLDDVKRLGVGILAGPPHVGDYDRPALELAAAAAAGVPVAFGSAPAQELRIAAALAINAGMPRAAAWRGLTTTAGHLAGLPESVGRLTLGAPADLVIWDGSPLDLRSRPLCVLVDGKISVSDASQKRPDAHDASAKRR